jgi:hypothetical protein
MSIEPIPKQNDVAADMPQQLPQEGYYFPLADIDCGMQPEI